MADDLFRLVWTTPTVLLLMLDGALRARRDR